MAQTPGAPAGSALTRTFRLLFPAKSQSRLCSGGTKSSGAPRREPHPAGPGDRRAPPQEPALPHPSAAQEPPRERPACPDGVSPLARRVLEKLAFSPQPVDEIAALLGERPAAVLAALTELEMQGCARCHAGGQYSLR